MSTHCRLKFFGNDIQYDFYLVVIQYYMNAEKKIPEQ